VPQDEQNRAGAAVSGGRRTRRRTPSKDVRHWLLRHHRNVDDKVLLEEYKTIRAEVTTSIQAQISILAFGAATIGFSFAAASQTSNDAFRDMFLLVRVPLVCYLILIVWFGEVMRMLRAGTFLMRLEKRFDEEFGFGALTWESTIFQTRCQSGMRAFFEDPDKFRTMAITLLFFTIAGTSIVIGWGSVGLYSWQHFFAISALAVAFAVVAWLYVLRQEEVERLAQPWLREGAEGPEVRELQNTLRLVSSYSGPIDGVFTEETQKAVEELQREHGLEVDGTVGLMTTYLLDELEYREKVATRPPRRVATKISRKRSVAKQGRKGRVMKGDPVAPKGAARRK
jgi:hypothetical protein